MGIQTLLVEGCGKRVAWCPSPASSRLLATFRGGAKADNIPPLLQVLDASSGAVHLSIPLTQVFDANREFEWETICWSPDGRHILFAEHVFSSTDGSEVAVLQLEDEYGSLRPVDVECAAFGPTCILATSVVTSKSFAKLGQLYFWNPSAEWRNIPTEVPIDRGHRDDDNKARENGSEAPRCVAWSHDGNIIATCCYFRSKVRVYDARRLGQQGSELVKLVTLQLDIQVVYSIDFYTPPQGKMEQEVQQAECLGGREGEELKRYLLGVVGLGTEVYKLRSQIDQL